MRTRLAVLLAVLSSAPALGVDTAKMTLAPANLHCPEPSLAQCTRTRVALLRSMARDLRALAAQKTDTDLSREDKEQLDRSNVWLLAMAARAETLAGSGASSTQDLMNATQQMQEEQMSFNLQYLMLAENMQNDQRQYTALSNIMKARYDTMKGILANLK
jgi:hypothetical protein